VCSSLAEDLSLSSLDEAGLLSLDTTGVVPEETQVFESRSSRHIEALDGLGDGRDAGFTLASETTSHHFDVNIE